MRFKIAAVVTFVCCISVFAVAQNIQYPTQTGGLNGNEFLPLSYTYPYAPPPMYTTPAQISSYVTGPSGNAMTTTAGNAVLPTARVNIGASNGVLATGGKFVAVGDSLSTGNLLPSPSTQSWPAVLATLPYSAGRLTFSNYAVNGEGLDALTAQYAGTIHPLSPAVTGVPGVLSITMLSNDYPFIDADGLAQYIVRFNAYLTTAKADGWQTLVFTVIPEAGRRQYDYIRVQFNDYVKGNTSLINYVVDPVGMFTDTANTAFYFSDGVHPSVGGSQQIAYMVQANLIAGGRSTSLFNPAAIEGIFPNNVTTFQGEGDTLNVRNTAINGYSSINFQSNDLTASVGLGLSNPSASLASGSMVMNLKNGQPFAMYQGSSNLRWDVDTLGTFNIFGQLSAVNGISMGATSKYLDVYGDNTYWVGMHAAGGFAAQVYMADDSSACLNFGYLTTGRSFTKEMGVCHTGAVTMPNLASSSAATTGTLCWTTGTGNVNVDTTVACLASDERLKNIGAPITSATAELMALKPITYRWKNDTPKAKDDPGEHIGLGAFATGYVDEKLIARDAERNPRGWRQDAMIALLVQAMQEQQREIAALKARH